jgi:hypothetical protein
MAGVEQNHICVIGRIRMNIALRPKRFRHTLTVIDIHLTPVCFDE